MLNMPSLLMSRCQNTYLKNLDHTSRTTVSSSHCNLKLASGSCDIKIASTDGRGGPRPFPKHRHRPDCKLLLLLHDSSLKSLNHHSEPASVARHYLLTCSG